MKGIATVRFTWSSEAGRPAEARTLGVFLTEAAAAGCDGVECADDGAAEVASLTGLQIAGGYVGAALHLPWDETGIAAEVMPVARRLSDWGADYLAVNCNPKGSWAERERKTGDELKRQGANLSRLAADCAPLGVEVVMHNHANRVDLHLDDLQAVTDHAAPEVGLCYDTGWSLTSGDDPVARAEQVASRIRAVHLRNQFGERPTEWLGAGEIDLRAFLAHLHAAGFTGWLTTELWHRPDVPRTRSLLENQQRSNDLLRQWWAELDR